MRLIDGDELKRKAQKIATDAWKMKLKGNVETILNQFIDWIDASPTIEIPERKTGKWTIEDVHSATYKYCCSECKAHHRARYDFCPTCGAKMLEEGGEEDD